MRKNSTKTTNFLVDLTNTIFDTRIQNIDKEISASNDYDQQIEAAGKMKDKSHCLKRTCQKEKELQKRKREIVKQAIFQQSDYDS
jgi:hypothetical protein